MAKKKPIYTYSFQFYKDHIHVEIDLRVYEHSIFYIHVTDQDSGETLRIPCEVHPKAYKKELLEYVQAITSENLTFTTYLDSFELCTALVSFARHCEKDKQTKKAEITKIYDEYFAEHGKQPSFGYKPKK